MPEARNNATQAVGRLAGLRVVMLVLNPAVQDARVLREAGALILEGASVDILSTSPDGMDHEVVLPSGVVVRQFALGGSARNVLSEHPARTVGPAARPWAVHRLGLLAVHRLGRLVARTATSLGLPLAWFAFFVAVARRARGEEWDVVHAHDLNTMLPALALARRAQVPLIYDSHELWRRRNRVGRPRRLDVVFDALLERFCMRRAEVVFTVSASIARWLEARYGCPQGHVRVLRNIPSLERGRSSFGEAALRMHPLLQNSRILLYIGRVTTGRGLELAVDALASLPNTVLVAMGADNAPYRLVLQNRAEDVGVSDRLIFVPPVPHDRVTAVAAEADAAVVGIEPICLSYRFALPNKLFEAIHAGVPVVAADLPEIRAIVETFDCGELFDTDDPQAFVSAAAQVLEDSCGYENGLIQAASALNWEKEREVLIEAYASFANRTIRRTH